MAENAALLATLGPAGIDLNFGCPARTVNQHRGGAVLLDEPELVGRIVAAVRRAVPALIPVSAKMRLGNRCDGPALDCARAIDEAGADELVVHARTRVQGLPPAGLLGARAGVSCSGPVAGDRQRRDLDGAGRLALPRRHRLRHAHDRTRPGSKPGPGVGNHRLPTAWHAVRRPAAEGIAWDDLLPLIGDFWRQIATRVEPRHRCGRLKQWLNYLRGHYPEAERAFGELRLSNDPASASRWLAAQRTPALQALA
jgi:tRNA-dihydrouridine synthase C